MALVKRSLDLRVQPGTCRACQEYPDESDSETRVSKRRQRIEGEETVLVVFVFVTSHSITLDYRGLHILTTSGNPRLPLQAGFSAECRSAPEELEALPPGQYLPGTSRNHCRLLSNANPCNSHGGMEENQRELKV